MGGGGGGGGCDNGIFSNVIKNATEPRELRLFKRWNTLRCFIQFNSEYIANPLFVISHLLNTLHGGREHWSSVGENGGGGGIAKNFTK